MATRGIVQRVNEDIEQALPYLVENNGQHPEYFKELTVQLLGGLRALELFPDLDKLDYEKQFSTFYNENRFLQ